MPSETPSCGPLAATLERLAALDPWFAADVGRPVGDGWHDLDALTVVDLAPWIDELARRHGGHRDVAGSYLGGWLVGAAVLVPMVGFVLERRVPDPAGPLWVRRHPGGWFDRVAFERPAVLVTAGDRAAGHRDARPLEEAEMVEVLGAGLAARLAPVLDAVRSLAPFGRRGLWGGVADELASAALWGARADGADHDEAWRLAVAVTDAVSARATWLRARPSPFRVAAPGIDVLYPVKGTCCLFYKSQPQPPDPCGDSYCTTCPFREDASRHERLVAHVTARTD